MKHRIKLSRKNTQSMSRLFRRLKIFDGLKDLKFIENDWRAIVDVIRYKPCGGVNHFKNVKQG